MLASITAIGTRRPCARLVSSGELDDVYAMELVFHNAYGPNKPWFYERALAGGGYVMDLGIHLVHATLWVLRLFEVASVSSRLFAKSRPMPEDAVEDYAIARLVSPPDDGGDLAIVNWTERVADGTRFDPEAQWLVDVARVPDAIYAR